MVVSEEVREYVARLNEAYRAREEREAAARLKAQTRPVLDSGDAIDSYTIDMELGA